MSDLAGRILSLALVAADRTHDGNTARLVLTGDGGGEWSVAMGDGEAAAVPDVTVTADVVDWCLLVGDRITPAALHYDVEGATALAVDLVTSAPALATL